MWKRITLKDFVINFEDVNERVMKWIKKVYFCSIMLATIIDFTLLLSAVKTDYSKFENLAL